MEKRITKAFTTSSAIQMIAINATLPIKDLAEGYIDNSNNDEGGVSSMNGRLNIRPRYQRAYVADMTPNWRENLINSILCGFPINRLYIGVCGNDYLNGALEMLDGQQRTKTICDFIKGDFHIVFDGEIYFFSTLSGEQKEQILNYNLDVTYCIGSEESRIKWFKRINQPNTILTNQELRNATYLGTFLESAKMVFSSTSGRAIKEINDKNAKYCITKYSTAKRIERCDFLEVALDWASYLTYENLRGKDDMDERICRYMAEHQNDENANKLTETYKAIIDWVVDTFWFGQKGFPSSQSFKNVDWVRLYCEYGDVNHTNEEKRHITDKCIDLVNNYKAFSSVDGIYEWVIRGCKDEDVNTYLSLRGFGEKDKDNMYMSQGGIDPIDGKRYPMDEMHAHHIKSWRDGGVSDYENLVWLSNENHRKLHAGDFGISPMDLRLKRDMIRKQNGNL